MLPRLSCPGLSHFNLHFSMVIFQRKLLLEDRAPVMLPVPLSGTGVTSEKINLKSIQKQWWEGHRDAFATGQCLYPWALAQSLPLVHRMRHRPPTPGQRTEVAGLFLNNCTKISYYRKESHVQVFDSKQLPWLISQYSVNFSGN